MLHTYYTYLKGVRGKGKRRLPQLLVQVRQLADDIIDGEAPSPTVVQYLLMHVYIICLYMTENYWGICF